MEELANATQQGGLHQLVSVRTIKSCPKVLSHHLCLELSPDG